jgi:chromosome segregation ATPase
VASECCPGWTCSQSQSIVIGPLSGVNYRHVRPPNAWEFPRCGLARPAGTSANTAERAAVHLVLSPAGTMVDSDSDDAMGDQGSQPNGRVRAIERKIDRLSASVDERFEQVDRRFEQIDHRFEQIDRRFEEIDRRFEQVDRRFEQVDRRFEQVDHRFEQVDRRFDGIESALIEQREYTEFAFERLDRKMDAGFARLERKVDRILDLQMGRTALP